MSFLESKLLLITIVCSYQLTSEAVLGSVEHFLSAAASPRLAPDYSTE